MLIDKEILERMRNLVKGMLSLLDNLLDSTPSMPNKDDRYWLVQYFRSNDCGRDIPDECVWLVRNIREKIK